MFGRMRRNRNRARDAGPRGGIDSLPVERADEAPAQETVRQDAPDPPAEDAAPVIDQELARQSTASRYEAERRMREDDQRRQTVFTCACVVAGFCGIAGVIFGTAAVCGHIGQPQQVAVAGPPGIVAGAQESQDIWYDAGGQMHINVHITREPDRELNIYIDQDGNVTTDETPADDGSGTGTDPSEADGQDGDPAEPPGDGGDGDDGDGSGNAEAPGGDAAVPKTEEELLAEMQDRVSSGGSGYLESDVQYVVQRGDTLSEISNRVGFSVDFLAAYNGIRDKNLIITGETLRYPSFTN